MLLGDVGYFAATPIGKGAYEERSSALLAQTAEAIEREWQVVDRRYHRQRQTSG